MGGGGTWDAIARFPGRFAAAAPVCGGVDTTLAAVIRAVPIWAFHGANDEVVRPLGAGGSWRIWSHCARGGPAPGVPSCSGLLGHDGFRAPACTHDREKIVFGILLRGACRLGTGLFRQPAFQMDVPAVQTHRTIFRPVTIVWGAGRTPT